MAGPGGNEVARVSIRVVPDVDGFKEAVERELRQLRDGEVDVSPDTKGFREKVKAAVASVKDAKVKVDTDLDVRKLKPRLEAAVKSFKDVQINLDANTADFKAKTAEALKGIKGLTLDVQADTKGLRSSIEAASRGKTGPINFNTALDRAELKAKAAMAAKAASGESIDFGTSVDTSSLAQLFKDTTISLKYRFTDPSFDGNLPGLKSDMQFLRDLAKDVKLDALRISAAKAEKHIQRVGRVSRVVGRSFRSFGSAFGSTTVSGAARFTRALRGIASAARSAVSPVLLMGKSIKWATGGYAIERKMLSFLDYVRNKSVAAGRAVTSGLGKAWRVIPGQIKAAGRNSVAFGRQLAWATGLDVVWDKTARAASRAGAAISNASRKVASTSSLAARKVSNSFSAAGNVVKQTVSDISKSTKSLGRATVKGDITPEWDKGKSNADFVSEYVQGLRKMESAKKAFNRNKLETYDEDLHKRYQKLVADAKGLKGLAPVEMGREFKRISAEVEKVHKGLGGSQAELKKFANFSKQASVDFGRLSRAARGKSFNIRVSDTFDAVRMSKKFQQVEHAARYAGRSINRSFVNSKAYAELQRTKKGLHDLANSYHVVGRAARGVGSVSSNASRKISTAAR